MNRQYYNQKAAFRLMLLLWCAVPPLVAAKVKIFIMIGQSNMYGQAKVAHLIDLKDGQPQEYGRYFDNNNNNDLFDVSSFSSRSDVRISSSQIFGKRGDFPSTDLKVGAGMRVQDDNFGPEIGFGWTVGDAYDEPVLIIKCSLGGTHLGVEWRSPSAPQTEYCCNFSSAEYGSIWSLMNLMVSAVTSDLEKHVPGHGNEGYEISGVIWMQGWSDAFNYDMRDDYEINLSSFVQDLLDLYGSNVPIMIAELGQEGPNPSQFSVQKVRQAQIDVVNAIGLHNVVFVPTSPYLVTGQQDFDGVHHYFGRADTIVQIGKAFGREIMQQLSSERLPSSPSPTKSPTWPPAPPPASCVPSGEGCTFNEDCCSGRCHRLSGSGNPPSCWNQPISKTMVKYGSERGGVNGSNG